MSLNHRVENTQHISEDRWSAGLHMETACCLHREAPFPSSSAPLCYQYSYKSPLHFGAETKGSLSEKTGPRRRLYKMGFGNSQWEIQFTWACQLMVSLTSFWLFFKDCRTVWLEENHRDRDQQERTVKQTHCNSSLYRDDRTASIKEDTKIGAEIQNKCQIILNF